MRIETSLNQAKRTCQASRPYVLVRTAEAEGFEPPVPLGTLAFKSQGNRVPGYVPGCRPAGFRAIRLAQRGADSSRLLHGCYTRIPGVVGLAGLSKPPVR